MGRFTFWGGDWRFGLTQVKVFCLFFGQTGRSAATGQTRKDTFHDPSHPLPD